MAIVCAKVAAFDRPIAEKQDKTESAAANERKSRDRDENLKSIVMVNRKSGGKTAALQS
jgi:hypothetical protein